MSDMRGPVPPNYPGHIARESAYAQRAGLALGGLLARLIFLVVAKVKVGHVDIHPAVGRGAVIAFNHRSMLDYLVCSIAFQRWGVHPHFFARGDLFARPVVGPFLRLIRAIPAGHGPGTTVTVDTAIDILRRGGVVALPPEGKVVDAAGRVGEVGTIRAGTGVMTSRAGTPILLLAIRNSDVAWPPGRRVPVVRPPWARPTISVSVAWLEVPTGTAPVNVTRRVADGLRELLTDQDASRG